jgi:hypothetical protein
VSLDPLTWLVIALGAVAMGFIVLVMMGREKRESPTKKRLKAKRVQTVSISTQSVEKTVTNSVINEAKDKLRLLDLEREILSYAIRRLYEASAEGKITEAERDRLALKYKVDLARIKEEIERGESIVALNELEKMQEDLVKTFSERLEEMNKKIEDLRSKSGFAAQVPKETVTSETMQKPAQMEQLAVEEELQEEAGEEEEKAGDLMPPAERTIEAKTKKTSKPKPSTEPEIGDAEKKVEQIVAEVDKVLKKLGRMEVEE